MFPPTLAYLDSNFTFTDSSDTFSDLQAADATADTIRTSLRRAEDAIVAALRSFNLERNKRVAVNKLPFEILSSIFESVVGDADHDPRPRLNISHTCTYWRDVATHDPALWTSIDLSHGEGLCRLFAERSQSLTLNLRLAGVYSLPKDHWRDTFWYGEIHRVRSLFLSTGSVAWDFDERPHRWIENTPAASLEELSVVIPARGRGRTHNISDILVGKQQLRYLTMTNIRMPWKPGQYTNLVKLHLVLHDQCNPEGESILHVFHDSPLLEDLLLHFDEAAHLQLDEPREEDHLQYRCRALERLTSICTHWTCGIFSSGLHYLMTCRNFVSPLLIFAMEASSGSYPPTLIVSPRSPVQRPYSSTSRHPASSFPIPTGRTLLSRSASPPINSRPRFYMLW